MKREATRLVWAVFVGLCFVCAACTAITPVGAECLTDANCGCERCCIGYRCATVGEGAAPEGADAGAPVERKKPIWVVRTLAGGGDAGYLDGQGTTALLDGPEGLALRPGGGVFLTEVGNRCVRAIGPQGNVETVAPDAVPCRGAALGEPAGIAVGEDGSIYVADLRENCIKRILDGTLSIVAGRCSTTRAECAPGSGSDATFEAPSGLAFFRGRFGGTLYVAEAGGDRIRVVVLSDRSVHVVAGQARSATFIQDGPCQLDSSCFSPSVATLDRPSSLAADGPSGLIIGERGSCAVRRLKFGDVCMVSTVGQRSCPSILDQRALSPAGVALGAGPTEGFIIVTESWLHRVLAIDANGAVHQLAGGVRGFQDGPGPAARFNNPVGVVVDDRGQIYVADKGNHRVRVLTLEEQP